ncbi:hypothetical protein QAD02_016217 [Eretmocerus hayati]|uniref:Uncharacterized protein n=1 Tax=Eretmocerus hayati TaxID=131215 RepID=A0ACC2PF85_9HYME|nr:hypothetical protein QAD02_016217 [Eretmocerus hayati]
MKALVLIVLSASCSTALPDETTLAFSKARIDPELSTDEVLKTLNTNELESICDLSLYEAGPSNVAPNTRCGLVSSIPDALSPEEERILKNLEQQNRDLEQLRKEMEAVWSSAERRRSHCRFREIQSVVQKHQPARNRSPPVEDSVTRSIRLKMKKARLKIELRDLEDVLRVYREGGYHPFEAGGPCNGQPDEIFNQHRSKRLVMAGFEAICTNKYNRALEIRREIISITEEIESLESEMST